MKAHLLPFGDLISYCLMPNHFHWQFFVRELVVSKLTYKKHVIQTEYDRRISIYGTNAIAPQLKGEPKLLKQEEITLNNSVGILLSSYTKAINHQFGMSGSIFRQNSKSKNGLKGSIDTNTQNSSPKFGSDYQFNVMEYIHKNPEAAGLVQKATDWNFSSAKDYAGLRSGDLCNLELGRKIMAEVY